LDYKANMAVNSFGRLMKKEYGVISLFHKP